MSELKEFIGELENGRWPEIGNKCYIIKGKRIVSQTRDLRKLIWYARHNKVANVLITRLIPRPTAMGDATARLYIEFCDGAFCGTDFASFEICLSFVKQRFKAWTGEKKIVLHVKTNERGAIGQFTEYHNHILKWNIRDEYETQQDSKGNGRFPRNREKRFARGR